MDSGFAQHLDRGFDSTATSEIGLLIATYRYPELVVDSGDPLVIDDKALSGTSSSSKSSTDAMALQTFATPAAKQSARKTAPLQA